MGDLLHLEGPKYVVVGVVEEDLVVGFHGGFAGDDDLALVEVFQTPEEVAVGVALGSEGALAVSLPDGKPAAVIIPQRLVALHRQGVGSEETGGSGEPLRLLSKASLALST